MAVTNPRVVAAKVLLEVIDQQQSLREVLQKIKHRQQGFIKSICYGVCRDFYALNDQFKQLVPKKIRPRDHDIKYLVLLAMHEIKECQTPPYAIVAESVNACAQLQKPWAKNFVNASLRRYSECQSSFLPNTQAGQWNHSQAFISDCQSWWPDQFEKILRENQNHPPLVARINQQKISRDQYLAQFSQYPVQAHPNITSAVLIKPTAVCDIPGFAQGYLSIQDSNAQRCVEFLACQPGERILDACAAPGGKLAHCLETVPGLNLTACEVSPARAEKIKENAQRLELAPFSLFVSDARDLDHWWDGQLFDRILIDAPCSATGIMRRAPDIKIHYSAPRIADNIEIQQELLSTLWPLLKPGGRLVYATCSIVPQENDQQIIEFCRVHSDAQPVFLDLDGGHRQKVGIQFLPGDDSGDGFYYAILQKKQ